LRASRPAGLLVALAFVVAASTAAEAFFKPPHFGGNNANLILAFGDSITVGTLGGPFCPNPDCTADRPYPEGLQALLVSTHPQMSVQNGGQGGERTLEGLARLAVFLDVFRPGYVLIMEGTNDASARFSTDHIVGNIHAMVQLAKARSTIPILGRIPPNFRGLSDVNGIIDAVNASLIGVAALEDVLLVDTFGALANPGLYGEDELHPTQQGYDQLAAAWRPGVVAVLNDSGVIRPEMAVETPGAAASALQPFLIGGWAVERAAQGLSIPGPGVDAVHVYAFPNPGSGAPAIFLGAASFGGARPDVGAAFGPQFTNSGFGLVVSGLAPGPYQIMLFAHSTVSGLFNNVRILSVVLETTALMSLDTPAPGATLFGPFLVGGWALDRAATSGTGVDSVHVYAFPAGGGAPLFLGVAAYGTARPDVGAIFGGQFTSSGFVLFVPGLPPGTYVIAAYAHSTAAGTFNNVRSAVVTALATTRAAIDTPGPGVSLLQPFLVAGWAIDLAASSGPGVDAVHVWAFPLPGGMPQFLGEASYGGSRPDLGAAFGSQFTGSGYGLVASALSPGIYQIVVYARSTVTGTFDARAVVVQVQ
jgi:lysophospholipase L1-like esterase